MTIQKSRSNLSKRISITISPEELIQWNFFRENESLSSFIRKAVNTFIENLNQTIQNREKINERISYNSETIQKIEEDLIEIQIALAKHDILPDIEVDSQIRHFINDQLNKIDLPIKDRQMFSKIKKKLR